MRLSLVRTAQVSRQPLSRQDRLALGGIFPYVRQALENYQVGAWFDSFGW